MEIRPLTLNVGLNLNADPICTLHRIALFHDPSTSRERLRVLSIRWKNNSGGNEPRVSLQLAKSPPPGQSGGSGA